MCGSSYDSTWQAPQGHQGHQESVEMGPSCPWTMESLADTFSTICQVSSQKGTE